jgi:hypothetical protein
MFTPSFSAIFKYKYTSDNHKNYGKLMKAQKHPVLVTARSVLERGRVRSINKGT